MRILSFDTSSGTLNICVAQDRQVRYEKVVGGSGAHRQEVADNLLPHIEAALNAAEFERPSLDAIVVGCGPGGFTGVRVGVVTAKTLAQALQLPLIGVSIFETIAWSIGVPAGIVLPSAKGLYFAAALQCAAQGPERTLVSPRCIGAGELAGCLGAVRKWTLHPEAAASLSAVANEALANVELPPFPVINNTAVNQLQIVWNRLSLRQDSGAPLRREELAALFSWRKVEPLYLRGPSISVR